MYTRNYPSVRLAEFTGTSCGGQVGWHRSFLGTDLTATDARTNSAALHFDSERILIIATSVQRWPPLLYPRLEFLQSSPYKTFYCHDEVSIGLSACARCSGCAGIFRATELQELCHPEACCNQSVATRPNVHELSVKEQNLERCARLQYGSR